jgi:hypothetical protein
VRRGAEAAGEADAAGGQVIESWGRDGLLAVATKVLAEVVAGEKRTEAAGINQALVRPTSNVTVCWPINP